MCAPAVCLSAVPTVAELASTQWLLHVVCSPHTSSSLSSRPTSTNGYEPTQLQHTWCTAEAVCKVKRAATAGPHLKL